MIVDKAIVSVVNDAFQAAAKATADYLAANGDRDACGFAWVVIKPANSKLAKYIKQINKGRPAYGGGIQVWNPSGNYTQAITAKEEGAQAFAKVLRDAGYTGISSDSRMD